MIISFLFISRDFWDNLSRHSSLSQTFLSWGSWHSSWQCSWLVLDIWASDRQCKVLSCPASEASDETMTVISCQLSPSPLSDNQKQTLKARKPRLNETEWTHSSHFCCFTHQIHVTRVSLVFAKELRKLRHILSTVAVKHCPEQLPELRCNVCAIEAKKNTRQTSSSLQFSSTNAKTIKTLSKGTFARLIVKYHTICRQLWPSRSLIWECTYFAWFCYEYVFHEARLGNHRITALCNAKCTDIRLAQSSWDRRASAAWQR